MTAVALPNGKQQFIDINGKPLVAGTVGMYLPATLIFKNTWQNAEQTVLNTNPIVLDSRGQALIYGAGTYRQIVKDAAGNLIWDQPVSVGGGGISGGNVRTTTISSNITTSDGTVIVNSASDTTQTLPTALSATDLIFNIKNINTGAVTIAGTIDGVINYVLWLKQQSVTVQSNGTSYVII